METIDHDTIYVLVVEDDPVFRTYLERVVRKVEPCAEIDWAVSAEEAIFLLRRSVIEHWPHYRLLIADIFLEGTRTGLDLWQVAQGISPDLPVLMTSSLPSEHFYRLLEGAQILPHFIEKPAFRDEGADMIRACLT